jgi:DNA-binding NarL/FixJ family response regulator
LKVLSNFFCVFLDWFTGVFIVALSIYVSLYLCPIFRAGPQALDLAQNLRPALVLMDVTMPGILNGLQATRQILKVAPATKVLMLSAYNDEVYVEEAINSGAMGYLVKQTSADNVCLAIREIHEGNTFFSPSIPRHLRKRNGKKKMA